MPRRLEFASLTMAECVAERVTRSSKQGRLFMNSVDCCELEFKALRVYKNWFLGASVISFHGGTRELDYAKRNNWTR